MAAASKLRTRLHPLETAIGAIIVAVFVGCGVILGTREWLLGLVWAGVAFGGAFLVFGVLMLIAVPTDQRNAKDNSPPPPPKKK